MVVSPRQLLSTLESASTPSTSSQRIEVLHAIRSSLHYFKSLLSYLPSNSSDRIQALKLNDDLHLSEVNCVRLLVSANREIACLLKLLADELPAGDVSSSNHRESCQTNLSNLFGQGTTGIDGEQAIYPFSLQDNSGNGDFRTLSKSKVFGLLEIIQFRCPDPTTKLSHTTASMKYNLLAEDILGNPGNSGKGGVYYYSERGDRLIDFASFHDKLWQVSNLGNEVELNDVRETIQQLLRWGWKYNKILEDQASQLHVLTASSQIVEVSASRRLAMFEDRFEFLFQILDASLSASASPDCSLKMLFIFSLLGCFDVDTTFTSLGATGRIAVGESSGLKNEESLKIGPIPKAPRLKRRVMLSVTFTYREPKMMYTHKDAIIMKNLLTNRFDFREEDIHLLMDRNRNERLISGLDVIDRLGNLTQGLGVDDVFVLYYSGHGERRNERSYVITPDTSNLNVRHMKRYLKNAPYSVYIVCDCCFGGGLRDLRAPNVVLIESARPTEVAYGGTDGSYFTKHLANILTQDNSKTADTAVNEANKKMMGRGSIQQASLFGTKVRKNSRLFV